MQNNKENNIKQGLFILRNYSKYTLEHMGQNKVIEIAKNVGLDFDEKKYKEVINIFSANDSDWLDQIGPIKLSDKQLSKVFGGLSPFWAMGGKRAKALASQALGLLITFVEMHPAVATALVIAKAGIDHPETAQSGFEDGFNWATGQH